MEARADERKPCGAAERTMFMTFSRGYPVSEAEELWRPRIDSFHMEEVEATQQALYARVVYHTPAMVTAILSGRSLLRFVINGKHVRVEALGFAKSYLRIVRWKKARSIKNYGDCIDSFHMEEVEATQQALYARVVYRTPAMVTAILAGRESVRFVINGKHVRVRHWCHPWRAVPPRYVVVQIRGHRKWRRADERKPCGAAERTVFMTFSRGYPVSEAEVRDYFTRNYGDRIDSFHMEEVEATQQALYARVVYRTPAMVTAILAGRESVRFVINGKHVRVRRWVSQNRT
ncbi:hypothetical protein Scep_013697 [Stephania cephalantha]|uniref:RRM domain-containing protein n=1 Tax=Stephania cephalantha TaxID=152367 RepID=A0AAP0IZW6_9MAGN